MENQEIQRLVNYLSAVKNDRDSKSMYWDGATETEKRNIRRRAMNVLSRESSY